MRPDAAPSNLTPSAVPWFKKTHSTLARACLIGDDRQKEMSEEPGLEWKSGGLRRLMLAARHQTAGLRHGLLRDPAIRQVTIAVLLAALLASIMPIPRIERLLLVLSVMLVAVVEVLNSAIEACVDRISLEKHPLSKVAKDYASVAVGGAVLMALLCWTVILGPHVLRWFGN